MKSKGIALWAVPLLLAGWLVQGVAVADDTPRYGPGMMGGGYPGPAPGMMGRGYGYGYGPGMMWGDDERGPWGGPGMMGGYGMGPGMMGGFGMGPGMMGGYGMGPGMMEPWWALELNDKQRSAIDGIMEDQHKAQWPQMSKMFEEQRKLDELYRAEKWDSDAIGKAYERIAKVQREMIELMTKTRNRIMEQLTPEQREQLKRYRWENRWRR